MRNVVYEPQLFTINVEDLQVIQAAFSFDFFQQRDMCRDNDSFSELLYSIPGRYELATELILAFLFLGKKFDGLFVCWLFEWLQLSCAVPVSELWLQFVWLAPVSLECEQLV